MILYRVHNYVQINIEVKKAIRKKKYNLQESSFIASSHQGARLYIETNKNLKSRNISTYTHKCMQINAAFSLSKLIRFQYMYISVRFLFFSFSLYSIIYMRDLYTNTSDRVYFYAHTSFLVSSNSILSLLALLLNQLFFLMLL